MFRMSFILKQKHDGSLILELPIWFRIIFLFIAVLLAAGVFVSGIHANSQWIPILIIIACIGGALYEEKWIFNKSENCISYISGTMLINRKKLYKFEDIEILNVTGKIHSDNEGKINRLRKNMAKFSMVLNSGKILDIDITTGKTDSAELKEKAQKIAAYCGIELAVDS
ncbi:MAG: hypothetical protein DRP58_04435 [Spirochaetes bacterium]|nr:MAG: hypothetical protein DRP58_04435 [Spirochaetota bacterium]